MPESASGPEILHLFRKWKKIRRAVCAQSGDRFLQSGTTVVIYSYMAALSISKTPPLILDKLNGLIGKLHEAKNTFERLASTFKNKELGQSVISLAQDSKQYASELSSQIQSLGGEARAEQDKGELDQAGLAGEKEWIIQDKEKDTLQFCAHHEASMLKAYREVLHEPYLHEGIRKMIRYQLNGILFAFSRIKLLNASLIKA